MAGDYAEKLKDPRWQRKRLEIFMRDGWTCCECGDSKSELQLHHKKYIKGREPWEYADHYFKTLCVNCHKREHGHDMARDRFFVKEGYRVMHYTGSDVVANPLKVAFEVMQMLGIFHAYEEKQLEKFDATDPFFRGW